MSLCKSGLLIGALSVGLAITDIYHGRINYAAEHLVLGGIVTVLFFALCHYGYEMVNWGLLLIVPVYILLTYVAAFFKNRQVENKVEREDDECETCHVSKKSCGCPLENNEPKINCPVKPSTLKPGCRN
jgi:branched-subunit amino acid ABC-type transport system permease component